MQINNINPSISFYNSFVTFISCAVKKAINSPLAISFFYRRERIQNNAFFLPDTPSPEGRRLSEEKSKKERSRLRSSPVPEESFSIWMRPFFPPGLMRQLFSSLSRTALKKARLETDLASPS